MARRVLTVALGVLACLVWAGCPRPEPPKNHGDSVRLMTFNVQFLPGSDDDESRAKRIAQRVKATDYDIVAFNEVFDEEARDVLIDELKGTFPNYVAYIGDAAVGTQDSGLMLFSRFKFIDLPDPVHRHDPDYLKAVNGGSDFKDVAFIEYDADLFPDNWAGKGAAFVRIRNPFNERIYNVAFSHLQASYPEDEDDQVDWLGPIGVRISQMEDVRKVIVDTIGMDWFNREDVFVMGDLNIDGDLEDPNLGLNGFDQPNLYEWVTRFDQSGSFFYDSMRDGWAFEQWPDDRGLTNMYHWGPPFSPDQGARLDYFLRNRPGSFSTNNAGSLCVQHMTLAHNMRDGDPFIESGFGLAGINELSDHIGLNIDINRKAPHCNPLEATLNPAMDTWLAGTITYPGSMQWFRVDAPGTYAFAVGGGVDFRVYTSTDLSTPVPQYREETTTFVPSALTHQPPPVTGKKYLLPDPPFFVRVFHPDRTATGNYQFIAHRSNCSSPNDACALRANEPINHVLPAAPLNAEDTAYFELYTDKAFSGQSQNLRFFIEGFTDPGAFELQLRRDDGVTVVDTDTTAEADPDNPGFYRLVIQRDDLDGASTKYYLTVKRLHLAALTYRIGWETNLTILHGQGAGVPGAVSENLFCVTETDSVGIDEIHLTVVVDDVTMVDDVYIGDYDDGIYRTLEDLVGTVGFTDSVKVTLRDEDGAANGDDDFLTTTIGPLDVTQTQSLNTTNVLSCCDGEYLIRYNRSRSLLH